jgi:hypothetical protein
MTRRTMHLVVLGMALLLLAGSAWAKKPDDMSITGNFFNPRPGSTTLCAKVDQMGEWDLRFTGETPYGLVFGAAPLFTNAAGTGCINTVWPQGVYKVKVKASEIKSVFGLVQGPKPKAKEDVAVSVFNPNGFCGAQGGGALKLFSYGVPPSVKKTLASRQATFAYIFKQSVPQNYGVFYFDTENPDHKVKFVARSFTDIFFDDQVDGIVPYKTVEVRGNSTAEIDEDDMPVHYLIYADNYPGDNWFRIQLWDFTGNLVYQSSIGYERPETTVFNGKNVVQPCP